MSYQAGCTPISLVSTIAIYFLILNLMFPSTSLAISEPAPECNPCKNCQKTPCPSSMLFIAKKSVDEDGTVTCPQKDLCANPYPGEYTILKDPEDLIDSFSLFCLKKRACSTNISIGGHAAGPPLCEIELGDGEGDDRVNISFFRQYCSAIRNAASRCNIQSISLEACNLGNCKALLCLLSYCSNSSVTAAPGYYWRSTGFIQKHPVNECDECWNSIMCRTPIHTCAPVIIHHKDRVCDPYRSTWNDLL